MNRRAAAIAVIAIFLAMSVGQSASAWHLADAGEPADEPPRVPDDPPEDTGYIPVDRTARQANELLGQANDAVATHYEVIGDTLNPVDEAAAAIGAGPITLYRDGAGGFDPADQRDLRDGGFGDVRMIGTYPWNHTQEAASHGREGYAVPSESDGTYPGFAASLLVTPEIDLRTNAGMEGRISDDDSIRVGSTVHQSAYWACDLGTYGPLVGVDFTITLLSALGGGGSESFAGRQFYGPVSPFCRMYRESFEPQHSLASLEYDRRFNLATGNDGVSVMVFTEPPTVELAQACQARWVFAGEGRLARREDFGSSLQLDGDNQDPLNQFLGWPPACRIVLPQSEYYPESVSALPAEMGYSGSSDWVHDAIDLSSWLNHRVWVGFYFGSVAIGGPSYFDDTRLFDTEGEFYGFHVDDLEVRSVAAPVNLGLRPLLEPSFTPPNTDGIPTLDPTAPIPVAAHVTNFGTRQLDVEMTSRILHINRTVAHAADAVHATLRPGAVLHLNQDVPVGLDVGRYIAQVCVARVPGGVEGTDPAADQADPEFCRESPPAGACAEDVIEADPCNRVRELRFDLRPVQALTPGAVELQQKEIQFGDTMEVGMTLANDGNTLQTVRVQPYHVDLRTGDLGQDLFPPEQRLATDVTIPPATHVELTWDLLGASPGQYRLLVQLNNTIAPIPTFDPDYALASGLLQPWPASAFAAEPDIAAQLERGWGELPDRMLGVAGARVAVGNDNTHLFVGLSNISAPGVSLYLNDLADGDLASGGRAHGLVADESGVVGFRYDGAWPATTPPEGEAGIRGGRGGPNSFGNFDYFVEVPANRTGDVDDPGLAAGPGDSVGVVVRLCAQVPDLECEAPIVPQGAPLADGDGFAPADGDMADELRMWHTIRLVDPSGASQADGVAAFSKNVLSTGFSVGGSQPPYFIQEFETCPSFLGWATQASSRSEFGGARDKWNCNDYPDAGRVLLYKGLSPDSQCSEGPCLPYSGIPHDPRHIDYADRFVTRTRPCCAGNLATEEMFVDGYEEDEQFLWTPAIEIPADAEAPRLLLSHQYSTDVDVEDRRIIPTFGSPFSEGRIRTNHVLQLSLERWVEDEGRWIEVGPLSPEGGFPTEESVGIRDLRFPPRKYYADQRPEADTTDQIYSSVDCSPMIRNFQYQPRWDQGAGLLRLGSNLCEFTDDPFSWWWPQGDQAIYRPPGGDTDAESFLRGGSPWQTDVVGLHDVAVGGAPLDLRGETVRFRFETFAADGASRQHDSLRDWGWRIGSIAVIEGTAFTKDLALESVEPVIAYDADKTGFGQGTDLQVRLGIRNAGAFQANQVRAHVVGIDSASPQNPPNELCRSHVDVAGVILPGELRNVTVPCHLPDVPGALLELRASVEMLQDREDFLGNNQQRFPARIPLTAVPDAAVRVDAAPRDAPTGEPRDVHIDVLNTGNVPVEDLSVTMNVYDIGNAGSAPLKVATQTWQATQALEASPDPAPLQALGGLSEFPEFTPAKPGDYIVEAVIAAPGLAPEIERATVRVTASDVLYRADFDSPAFSQHDVIGDQGEIQHPAAWAIRPNGGHGGSARMAVGDSGLREIPAGTDAALELPSVDLSLLRSAKLSFRHSYDLESGFDAARVEISTDGGDTWRPIQPRKQPLNGLPDGYPSERLVGRNGILSDDVECFACAYTGSSEDLVGNDDGWVSAEFDLSRDPRFWSPAPIDDLTIRDGQPDALPFPVGGRSDPQFFHPSWALDEPDAEVNQRYWWISNLTYTEPQPLTANRMWWSGSAGEPDWGEMPPVDTTLAFQIPTQSDWDMEDDDQLVLTYWDWRAGWRDTADSGRDGTGGEFLVAPLVENPDAESQEVVVERLESGWTKREVDVTHLADADFAGAVFRYVSGSAEGTPVARGHRLAEIQDNRGWFIDRLELVRRPSSGEDETLAMNEARDSMGALVSTNQGDIAWARISAGDAANDGGWRLASAEVPGEGSVDVWRFAADNRQGYPNGADARLVTPSVDLRTYGGDSASLRFDHQYRFHGLEFSGGTRPGRAIDGGVVEYQVLDETTGVYGPWKTLSPQREQATLGFRPHYGFGGPVDWAGDLFLSHPLQEADLAATGYSAIAPAPFVDRPEAWFIGLGANFETTPGWVAPTGFRPPDRPSPELDAEYRRIERGASFPYPFAHVFSGESDGWETVDWDVSDFIGHQVRFAFHVWTNPSTEPCEGAFTFLGNGHDANLCSGLRDELPFHGWSVANVEVAGQEFRGEPAQIRLRVATDRSMEKGDWSIDDVQIVGQRHRDAVVVRANETFIRDSPGEVVTFEGVVRNLGISPKVDGLALTIEAREEDTGAKVSVQVLEPATLGSIDSEALQPGIDHAMGPFSLAAGGRAGSELPVKVALTLPEGAVEVTVRVLEDVGVCRPDEDGTPICESMYEQIRNDQGAGSASTVWRAVGVVATDLRFVAPWADRGQLIVADPAAVNASEPVAFHAAVQNNGTVFPPGVKVEWTVNELLRKGDPQAQRGTREEIGQTWSSETLALAALSPGESVPIGWDFTPPRSGVYRTEAKVFDDDDVYAHARLEFPVGGLDAYYAVDFAQTEADTAGWQDAPPQGPEAVGQSPNPIGFRQSGPQFIWGVSPEQWLFEQLDYCYAGGCNPTSPSRSGTTAPRIYGLHGIAEGPVIDLGRVVGDQAVLTVRNGHVFQERDGGVVEALPLVYPLNPVSPQPAFTCTNPEGDATPMWFRLETDPPSAMYETEPSYPPVRLQTGTRQTQSGPAPEYGWTSPRHNPVAPAPFVGGPGVDAEVLRFPLAEGLAPICPPGFDEPPGFDDIVPQTLVNYTLQLRLRAGTTPGLDDPNCERFNNAGTCVDTHRVGAMGWQIDSMGMSSVDVVMLPVGGWDLDILDGFPKRFNMRVTNSGPIDEVFDVGLHVAPGARTVPEWFSFPELQVRLAPGETRLVPFDVFIPPEPRQERGGYEDSFIRISSRLDPNIFSESQVRLNLRDHVLPDLAVDLDVQADEPPPEPGKVVRIIPTVHNVGHQSSTAAPLRIDVIENPDTKDEARATVGTASVDPLCPRVVCESDGSWQLHVVEWVPEKPGKYRIEVVADPDGRLLQESRSNDKTEAIIEVLSPLRPDVRVANLTFHGVQPDGYALQGELVTFVANITNQGTAPATGAQVLLMAGTAELLETTIDSLAPGQTVDVRTSRIAVPGETAVRAVVLPGFGDENRGDSKDELVRVLRVRGLDIQLEPEPAPVAVTPGANATTTINVTNHGNAIEHVILSLDPAHTGWSMAASPNPVTLAPNTTAWSAISLRAPADSAAGRHEIAVFGSPQSQPALRTVAHVAVDVATNSTAPQLLIHDADASGVNVEIQSRSNAPQNVTLRLDDPSWGTATPRVNLSPYQATNATVPVSVPALTPPGPMAARLVAVDDSGEELGRAIGVIQVTARPDGTAELLRRVDSPEQSLNLRVFQFTLNVTNSGNVPFGADVVATELSEGVRHVPAAETTVVPSAATAQVPVAFEVDADAAGWAQGTIKVFMRSVETDDGPQDLLATDPIATIRLPPLAALPDLVVDDVAVRPRGIVAVGDPVRIGVTLHNQGLDTAPETELFAYVNGDLVDIYPVRPLADGAEEILNLSWAFPVEGDYLFHFVSDGGAMATETFEDNNGASGAIQVEAGPWYDEIPQQIPGPPVLLLLAALCAAGLWAHREPTGRRRHERP